MRTRRFEGPHGAARRQGEGAKAAVRGAVLRRTLAVVAVALLTAGCESVAAPDVQTLGAGSWGGDRWGLLVREDGTARIEGVCMQGEIDEPIRLAEGGAVVLDFTVQLEAGPGRRVATHLEARLAGDVLEGTITGGTERLPFRVERGRAFEFTHACR